MKHSLRPMFGFKRPAFNAMSFLALSCLLLRSLVAPGWMLVADPGASGNLMLVLCPAQNRDIDLEHLAERGAPDNHSHNAAKDDDSSSRSTHDHDGPLHAESLDSSCGLWSGSATANVLTAAVGFVSFGILDSRILTARLYFSSLKYSPSQPRAPPIV
ncbi:MAG: hypothetical protein ACI915_005614 [Gammaproteobacteria bacterium]|jgi:hypothetical protein